MNPGRFYVPQYMHMGNNLIYNGMRNVTPMIRMTNNASRGMGIFGKITNGIRSVNWGGLLNNANKTLNVVNQTIPLVRQAGPMVNNMKSMLRIAKAFGNETTNRRNNNIYNKQINSLATNGNVTKENISNLDVNMQNYTENNKVIYEKENQNNNVPNFFI